MNSITMQLQADKLIRMALEEDITSEDVSTNAVMPTKVQGTVDLIAKEDGVIAGMDVYARVFKLLDEDTEIEMFCHDGDEVREGDLMAKGDRRYQGSFVWRKSCAELSAADERNCHLYKKCGKASGRQWCDTA